MAGGSGGMNVPGSKPMRTPMGSQTQMASPWAANNPSWLNGGQLSQFVGQGNDGGNPVADKPVNSWRNPMMGGIGTSPFGGKGQTLPGMLRPQTLPGMQQQAAAQQPQTQPPPAPAATTPAATPAPAPPREAYVQQPYQAPGAQVTPSVAPVSRVLTYDPGTFGYYDTSGKWYDVNAARAFMAGG